MHQHDGQLVRVVGFVEGFDVGHFLHAIVAPTGEEIEVNGLAFIGSKIQTGIFGNEAGGGDGLFRQGCGRQGQERERQQATKNPFDTYPSFGEWMK